MQKHANDEDVVIDANGDEQSIPHFIKRLIRAAISFRLKWADPIRFHGAPSFAYNRNTLPLTDAACKDPEDRLRFPPIRDNDLFPSPALLILRERIKMRRKETPFQFSTRQVYY